MAPKAPSIGSRRPRVLYLNVDSTLLGADGALPDDGDHPTLRALEICRRHGVEVVPISGRSELQVRAAAAALSLRAYVCEAGALLVDGTRRAWQGVLRPHTISIRSQIEATGALDALLHAYRGMLEADPTRGGRFQAATPLRGSVPLTAAKGLLDLSWPESLLVDDGVVVEHDAHPGVSEVRAYHLLPRQATKAFAIARHREWRGLQVADVAMVGSSLLDLDTSGEVGTLWLLGDALHADRLLAASRLGRAHVRSTSLGAAGVLEVAETIARRLR